MPETIGKESPMILDAFRLTDRVAIVTGGGRASAAPSPPPHGNFATQPVVYRGPYEYSVPGHREDFFPQHLGAEV